MIGAGPRGSRQQPGQPLSAGLFSTADRSPCTVGGLAPLALSGLALAEAGALGPAIWGAATKTTTALRAE